MKADHQLGGALMKQPAVEAAAAVIETMRRGSSKDGNNDDWRKREIMYHLSKAQAHLATHIKKMHDPRAADGENHLHLALTRIAMALCIMQ